MSVPSVITDLSVIAASNSPAGSDSIGTSLDDYLRSVQAIIKREQAQGAAIASSATTAIGGNTDGNYLHITGTTTITSFGTVAAGISRTVVFDGALTLTHSASLILPGGSNITTAAGDAAEFVSEGSGVWRCVGYLRAAGQYLFNGQTATASLAGNLNLSGSGARILGDFSNATVANRVMFQTSTANSLTSVSAIPNGSGTAAEMLAWNGTDTANGSYLLIGNKSSYGIIAAGKTGSGTYLPMTFYAGGSERMRIDTSGRITNAAGSATDVGADSAKLAFVSSNIGGPIASGTTDANVNYRFVHSSVALDNGVYAGGSVWWQARSLSSYATNYDINFQPNGGNTLHVGSNGGLGYGTGAGGSVIQATSRTAAVALNKPSGDITLFSAAGSATAATFTVNNSLVSATDVPIIAVRSATNKYITAITNVVASTSFDITFWTTGGTATDSPIFHFNLGKGSAT